jgi:RND family efflux transporter MFP subunit
VIRAPTAGVVSKRAALIGSVVNPTTELFRLIRDGRIELDAQVPELDLDVVRPGQSARILRGAEAYAGTVRLVAPVVDAASRLGIVHIALGRGTPLKPGMFARAEIDVGEASSLAVPDAALVFRDGRPGVFAINAENRVALHAVETGLRKAGWVEVTTGVERGQRIVVAGAGFLNDGDLVRVDTASRSLGATE